MKKSDWILFAACLLLGAVGMLILWVLPKQGDSVRIMSDGKEYAVYSLSEDREITIESDYGQNVLVIRGGSVFMKEADCPDRYCVEHAPLEKSGEPIVCLPHRIVVEIITKEKKGEYDGIAK